MASASFPGQSAGDRVAVLALGMGYLAIAAFTLKLTRFDGGVAFVWPATAVLLVNLTRTPPGR